ncbi:phage protein [Vibrio fluvialis]
MKYHEMSKNYIFREFECGLSREQTAELCFKSVRTVTEWDKGKAIPPECRRLMRFSTRKELSFMSDWAGFVMHFDKLELPNGKLVSAQEVILGIALIEIQADNDTQISSKILTYSRIIEKIKNKPQ